MIEEALASLETATKENTAISKQLLAAMQKSSGGTTATTTVEGAKKPVGRPPKDKTPTVTPTRTAAEVRGLFMRVKEEISVAEAQKVIKALSKGGLKEVLEDPATHDKAYELCEAALAAAAAGGEDDGLESGLEADDDLG